MGDKYQYANITGVDLSPIQPEEVPPNVFFLVDDIEASWAWEPDQFQLIHCRNMVWGIKDWDSLLQESLV